MYDIGMDAGGTDIAAGIFNAGNYGRLRVEWILRWEKSESRNKDTMSRRE